MQRMRLCGARRPHLSFQSLGAACRLAPVNDSSDRLGRWVATTNTILQEIVVDMSSSPPVAGCACRWPAQRLMESVPQR